MDTSRMEMLNREYEPLRAHTHQVLKALKASQFEYEWGYFAQHSVRNGEACFFEHYPIPVITVRGICEIGFDLNQTFIEFVLGKAKALELDFTQLQGFDFEVYGMKEYLSDFYNSQMDIKDLHARILAGDGNEIGVSFLFGRLEPAENIVRMVNKIRAEWGEFL